MPQLPKGDDGEGGPATFGWGDHSAGDDSKDFRPDVSMLPQLLGEGWGTAVVMTGAEVPDEPLLDQLTEPVEGGRMLSTALLSVLLTDDGRVLAGAVTPEHLLDLAGR